MWKNGQHSRLQLRKKAGEGCVCVLVALRTVKRMTKLDERFTAGAFVCKVPLEQKYDCKIKMPQLPLWPFSIPSEKSHGSPNCEQRLTACRIHVIRDTLHRLSSHWQLNLANGAQPLNKWFQIYRFKTMTDSLILKETYKIFDAVNKSIWNDSSNLWNTVKCLLTSCGKSKSIQYHCIKILSYK